MFSFGNITEKLRIASFNCRSETVVDLYAGNFSKGLKNVSMVHQHVWGWNLPLNLHCCSVYVPVCLTWMLLLVWHWIFGVLCSPIWTGIGYFTLPYLLHAGAAHVHACEWNPDAVEALKRNLQLNRVAHRCTVHQGDNRQVWQHLFLLLLSKIIEYIFYKKYQSARGYSMEKSRNKQI